MKPVTDWYYRLSVQDRKALVYLCTFLALVLVYLLCWKPSLAYKASAERAYTNSADLFNWVQENAPRARSLDSSAAGGANDASLLSVVGSTSRNHGIGLRRYEPNSNNGMRIWLENIPFNTLIVWLDDLSQNHNISIIQLTVDKRNSGYVDARIELSR